MVAMQWTDNNGWFKTCSKCLNTYNVGEGKRSHAVEKLKQFFTQDRKSKDGLYAYCKECVANIVNKRPITDVKREDLLKTQDNKCGICEKPVEFNGYHTACIDHDHVTNKVRGILCSPCNKALGMFCDDIDILQKAIDYLQRHNT